MISAFLEGTVAGLILAILIGPVFFVLIKTGIKLGFAAGFSVALGVALSDAVYIGVAYLGVSKLIDNEVFKMWLGLLGGAIMVIYGIVSVLKKVTKEEMEIRQEIKGKDHIKQFMKGFMLNVLNPFVLVFWIGVVSAAGVRYADAKSNIHFFFAGIIFTIIATDSFKLLVADKLSHLVTSKLMTWLHRISGAVLFVFGAALFYYVFAGLDFAG